MIKPFLLALFVLFLIPSFAQPESDSVETEDIVVLFGGETLKGKIVSFSEKDGDLKFVDHDGRTYFLKSEDYEYFKKDVPIEKKRKERKAEEPKVINERKEDQFQLSAGLGLTTHIFQSISATPVTLKSRDYSSVVAQASFGKYFTRNHYVGASLEFPVSSSVFFINPRIKYQYQFDKMKSNLAHYIPVSFDFLHFKSPLNGFPFEGNPATSSAVDDYTVEMNSMGLSIGYGMAFILENTRSIGLELLYHRYTSLSTNYLEPVAPLPDDLRFSTSGIRLAAMFNF